MEKAYTVRRKVINATLQQWDKLEKIIVCGAFSAEVEEVKQVVGVFGCLTDLANEEELEFFKLLHSPVLDSKERPFRSGDSI